jgi:hypothetical protein
VGVRSDRWGGQVQVLHDLVCRCEATRGCEMRLALPGKALPNKDRARARTKLLPACWIQFRNADAASRTIALPRRALATRCLKRQFSCVP